MCGIAGILDWRRPPRADELEGAVERMRRRGPDHQGTLALGPLAFGHTRLAIIDLQPESNQPMCDVDDVAWIVFNGEIYNYRELRRELEAAGSRFRTASDTEVILEAYKAWGPRALKRLNGMFALAIWDQRSETLLLARDRLGEKPLFYTTLRDGRFVFASDLWALRTVDGVNAELEPSAIGQFLSLNYLLGDTCILKGVHKLAAGHWLTRRRDAEARPQSYWDLASRFHAKAAFRSEDEAIEALDALIDDAVRLRMVSDVPLGVFLSGGVDSSTVVDSMCRTGGRPPRSFTIDFTDPGFSEAAQARATAAHLGAEHQDRRVDLDAAGILPKIVGAVSEPFADTSIIPTYHLSRFARESVTVCLSGDGADEILAGYETYKADRLRHLTRWLPALVTRGLHRAVQGLLPPSFGKVGIDYKLQQFLRGHALSADAAHIFWRTIFDLGERQALLRPEVAEQALAGGDFNGIQRHFDAVRGCHYLDRGMYVDIKTWLADDILVKVDQTSMAHSLEVRAPFLDHRLVEFAAALPVDLKLKGLKQKYLLKKSRTDSLPADVISGRKQGFNAPVSRWFNEGLAEVGRAATLQGPLTEWLQTTEVERLWDDHRARRRDNGFKLFGLTCLGLWMSMKT